MDIGNQFDSNSKLCCGNLWDTLECPKMMISCHELHCRRPFVSSKIFCFGSLQCLARPFLALASPGMHCSAKVQSSGVNVWKDHSMSFITASTDPCRGSKVSWLPGVRIVVIIESCRRLLQEEKDAFEAKKTQAAYKKRHLLPSMQALRQDMAGLQWTAYNTV